MAEAPDYDDLMTRFRRAFARADPELFAEVLGAGFEWHTHTFDPDAPEPTGRVLHGVEGIMAELAWRRDHWSQVRFDGLIEHFAPKLVTQSFTISGVDRGRPFAVAAVDLYTLDADDRIVRKDTYWKQPGRR